jgi:hypothetical protein
LTDFGVRPGFWDELLTQARLHGMGRPLYYMLRHTQQVTRAQVPREVELAASEFAPGRLVNRLMDWLFAYRFACDSPEHRRLGTGFAIWLLYMRAHWLRMPPLMLARHLTIKTVRRVREAFERKPEEL